MPDAKQEKPKRRFHLQLPHVYTIAFMLIVFFAVLTWIVPSGQFDRQTIQTAAGEREVAVAGTYQEVDKVYTDSETGETVDLRQGIDAVLQAPAKGIQAAADVVAFVLLIGGSFAIVTKTNALNAGMSRVIKKLKNKDILIIPISMILLSICGTTFGMSEEALPFYAIFIPIMLSIGYDSMTAFIICFLGPNLGYCASTIDPFNVLIAQGVIGIEGNPQLWLRAILWVIFTAAGIFWAMRYARRVKLDPKSSITYEDDKQKRIESLSPMPLSKRSSRFATSSSSLISRSAWALSCGASLPRAGIWTRSPWCSWPWAFLPAYSAAWTRRPLRRSSSAESPTSPTQPASSASPAASWSSQRAE